MHNRSVNFSSADLPGCGMESDEDGTCQNSDKNFEKDCCHDKTTNYQVDDTYKIPSTEKFSAPEFAAIFFLAFNNLLVTQSAVASYHPLKEAPPLKTDIIVLIQSFLI
ncbi:MAG TPA: hypothetical protein PKH65_02745 [Bacteroidia bacterium]|nr:hypothetical protein [Bacteroidia bacterium]